MRVQRIGMPNTTLASGESLSGSQPSSRRSGHSRRHLLWTLGLFCAATTLGCKKPPPEPLVKPGMYQSGPEELSRLWHDILAACKADDRNRVHELMRSFVMTQPQLTSLLGPTQGQALWARYQAMLGSLVNAGAVELVAHVYEKKYDDISVTRIDQLPVSEQTDTDRAVLAALINKPPIYTVRVKRKTEAKGLRYDFFVYLDGYWRSGNLLGKFLPPVPGPKPATDAPVDAGAPPADAHIHPPEAPTATTPGSSAGGK